MIFWITNDRYSSAEGSYHIAFRNGVLGVIGAFGVNIGLEREEQLFDSRLIENRHKVNSFQCGYDLGSLVLGYERPAIALQDRKSTRLNSSHRCISYAVFCLKKKNET